MPLEINRSIPSRSQNKEYLSLCSTWFGSQNKEYLSLCSRWFGMNAQVSAQKERSLCLDDAPIVVRE